jgi:hypothetical protein
LWPAPSASQAAAGHKIAIPAGPVRAGSAPGTALRDPGREAHGVDLLLPAFAIDALPFPNDPALPAQPRTTRAEASALCGARGDRLCTELEWERACEGPEHGTYPFAPAAAASCLGQPAGCATAEGVAGPGLFGREWTSSPAASGVGDALRSAVVRGAPAGGELRTHRCDARDAATPDSRSDTLLFRCCRGAAPSQAYPDEPAAPPLLSAPLAAAEARKALAAMPGTRHIADEFKPFTDADVQRALASIRASRTSLAPWRPLAGLVSWSPVPRERVRVLAGDAPQGAAVVIYYPDVAGVPLLITSYETRGEHAPIVVAGRTDNARELLFSTCWGCGGEGGAIRFSDDARVRVELR